MKNRLLALLLLMATLLSVTSCGIIFGDVAEQGDITVVVENTDGSFEVYKTYLENVENKSEGAKGVIEHLNKRERDPLTFEMIDGAYGAYLTAIGNIREGDGYYVIVYTSVKADSYEGAPTVQYEGVTLYQAGLGLSGMRAEAGEIILFRLERSPY